MKIELEKILSVSGKAGLYNVISSGKNAIVIESLIDGKRIAVTPTQKISSLNDISMFTSDEDVKLRDVLLKAKELFAGGPAPDTKGDGKQLRSTMKTILPTYDAERVYESDIKKLLTWYNILQSKDMLDFAEPKAKEGEENEEKETDTTEVTEEKSEE